jgi:aminoglycoside phosphotransferase (APT) family kinase protein
MGALPSEPLGADRPRTVAVALAFGDFRQLQSHLGRVEGRHDSYRTAVSRAEGERWVGYRHEMFRTTPLASGRDADVFAIDATRVLRRYRDGGDVAAEAAVMAYVADAGFPVPRVYRAEGTEMVMERVYGPTMLQALIGGDLGVQRAAALLADLHRRLHELPSQLKTGSRMRILHLDLHPDNVMLSAQGPMVIDWRNTTEGSPDLDLAMTAVILAQVAVDEAHAMAAAAGRLLSAFLRHAVGDVASMVDSAIAIRRVDPALTAVEADRLTTAAALITGRR